MDKLAELVKIHLNEDDEQNEVENYSDGSMEEIKEETLLTLKANDPKAVEQSDVEIDKPEWLGNAEDTDNLQLAWKVIKLAKATFPNMTGKLTGRKNKDVDTDPGRYTGKGVGHPIWKPGIAVTVVQKYTMEGVGYPVRRSIDHSRQANATAET